MKLSIQLTIILLTCCLNVSNGIAGYTEVHVCIRVSSPITPKKFNCTATRYDDNNNIIPPIRTYTSSTDYSGTIIYIGG